MLEEIAGGCRTRQIMATYFGACRKFLREGKTSHTLKVDHFFRRADGANENFWIFRGKAAYDVIIFFSNSRGGGASTLFAPPRVGTHGSLYLSAPANKLERKRPGIP